jgi:hypothetical protein
MENQEGDVVVNMKTNLGEVDYEVGCGWNCLTVVSSGGL